MLWTRTNSLPRLAQEGYLPPQKVQGFPLLQPGTGSHGAALGAARVSPNHCLSSQQPGVLQVLMTLRVFGGSSHRVQVLQPHASAVLRSLSRWGSAEHPLVPLGRRHSVPLPLLPFYCL